MALTRQKPNRLERFRATTEIYVPKAIAKKIKGLTSFNLSGADAILNGASCKDTVWRIGCSSMMGFIDKYPFRASKYASKSMTTSS